MSPGSGENSTFRKTFLWLLLSVFYQGQLSGKQSRKAHVTITLYLDFTFKTTFYYNKEDTANGVTVGSGETFN